MPTVHIALVHPEIPQNTGNIGRLALAADARLHLVHPLGFSTDEKAVRRAGLDYWKHVDVREHAHLDAFLEWTDGRRVHVMSSASARPYTTIPFQEEDVLVFGCESVGLPWPVVERFGGGYVIPMIGQTRSLNLSNAAALVVYEALRSLRPALFGLAPTTQPVAVRG